MSDALLDAARRAREVIRDALASSPPYCEESTTEFVIQKLHNAGLTIAAAEAGGWRPISEAPTAADGLKVWVFGGRYDKPELVYADGDWWRYCRSVGLKPVPEHWHPEILPPPPPQEGPGDG